MLCRPCVGWLPLKHSACMPALIIAVDGGGNEVSSPTTSSTLLSLKLHAPPISSSNIPTLVPPFEEAMLRCNSLASLPLRSRALDCILIQIADTTDSQHLNTSLSQLGPLLNSDTMAHALICIVLPGRLTADMLVLLEEALNESSSASASSSFSFSSSYSFSIHPPLQVVSLRQFTSGNLWQCGPSVLELAGPLLSSRSGSRNTSISFGLIQLQRYPSCKPPTTTTAAASAATTTTTTIPISAGAARLRLLHLLETSLYLDQSQPGVFLPSSDPSLPLTPAELAYLHPPPPSSCSLHLPNYYDNWQALYPSLRFLLDDFEGIKKEALSVSSWTPWPEYHFRDGGGENDWRVVPFLHTFPATDPKASTWIESTCTRCPTIRKALEKMRPFVRTALLSRLGPDTRLSAHTGWEDLANYVLRVHMTLVVPKEREGGREGGGGDLVEGCEGYEGRGREGRVEGGIGVCGTWVEGEVRCHREKEFVVFDDSKVHKAFNLHKTEARVVLILDLVRPGYVEEGVAVGGHTEELDKFISAFN